MSREIMQQALDALLESKPIDFQDASATWRSVKAIAALEAELAKPEQPTSNQIWMSKDQLTKMYDNEAWSEQEPVRWFQQFGDAPPRKEWVGLTDDEILDIAYQYDREQGDSDLEFARRVLVAQKEKNE